MSILGKIGGREEDNKNKTMNETEYITTMQRGVNRRQCEHKDNYRETVGKSVLQIV